MQEPNFLMVTKVTSFIAKFKIRLPHQNADIDVTEFKDNEKEGLGFVDSPANIKVDVEVKINHDGEVNRARHMPQKFNIIATKTIMGEVHIFDYHKHPSKPVSDTAAARPELRLTGHERDGYGLSWNKKSAGLLLSGSDDGIVI
jgi:histone-binding protein RBBP4